MSMAPGVPGLRQDLSYAFRLWRKHPVTAVLAVAALAVGIGAAAAIFSIINAVLIQPLPYREPGRFVIMWDSNERDGFDIDQMKKLASSLSPPEYHDWRTRTPAFTASSGCRTKRAVPRGSSITPRCWSASASPSVSRPPGPSRAS